MSQASFSGSISNLVKVLDLRETIEFASGKSNDIDGGSASRKI